MHCLARHTIAEEQDMYYLMLREKESCQTAGAWPSSRTQLVCVASEPEMLERLWAPQT